jgi:hypothetical protein
MKSLNHATNDEAGQQDPDMEIPDRYSRLCGAVLVRALIDYHKWQRMTPAGTTHTVDKLNSRMICESLGRESESWILGHAAPITIERVHEVLQHKQQLSQFQDMCLSAETGNVLEGTYAWLNPYYLQETELAAEIESSQLAGRSQLEQSAPQDPKQERRTAEVSPQQQELALCMAQSAPLTAEPVPASSQ